MAKAKKAAKKPTRAKAGRGKGAFDLDAALSALPASAADTPPSMPVAALLQEASDVAQAAAKHGAKLKKLPLDYTLVTSLPARCSALAKAETAWRAARVKGVAKSAKQVEAAVKLRSELIAAGRYLLRDDDTAQRVLDDISAGDGLADLISDLSSLATFCTEHKADLRSATMRGGIDKAIAEARSLSTSIQDATSEHQGNNAALHLR